MCDYWSRYDKDRVKDRWVRVGVNIITQAKDRGVGKFRYLIPFLYKGKVKRSVK